MRVKAGTTTIGGAWRCFKPSSRNQTSRDEVPLASMVKTGRKDWAAPELVTGRVQPGRLAEW